MDSMSHFDENILVTGSNGFIGAKVVEVLLKYGCRNIRCFVRPSSQRDRLDAILRRLGADDKVEIVTGDLRTPADCVCAAGDVTLVYHLAAGFDKSFDDAFANSTIATQNLLEAFAVHGKPRRFVNVSSFAVYSNFRMERGAPLDETSPIEESPRERLDAYRRHVGRFLCFPVPYGAAYFLSALCELCAKFGRPFPKRFNRRRCAAEWKGNRFSNHKLHEQLGWQPRVPMNEAMKAFLEQFD